MKIKWLGHASFLVSSDSGIRIITDPYTTDDELRYGDIRETADIVTVSHSHFDHNNIAAVRGNPKVINQVGTIEVKGIKFNGIPTYHDEARGKSRGNNIIFCFDVDELKICHLGDLGHRLSNQQMAELGKIDILLIPVGGYFTIDAQTASQISEQLAPRVVIPMHFKTSKCNLPISGVDEFLKGKGDVKRLDTSEAEFKPGQLPAATQIVVLKSAR